MLTQFLCKNLVEPLQNAVMCRTKQFEQNRNLKLLLNISKTINFSRFQDWDIARFQQFKVDIFHHFNIPRLTYWIFQDFKVEIFQHFKISRLHYVFSRFQAWQIGGLCVVRDILKSWNLEIWKCWSDVILKSWNLEILKSWRYVSSFRC